MQIKEERIQRFRAAGLYLVITSEFCGGRSPLDVLRSACEGGIKLVQLREKSISGKALYEMALEFRRICNKYGVLMMMNDHVDIALAAGADGVHLGQSDLPVTAARAIAPDLILGLSTHSVVQALAGQNAGADYVNIGPLFATSTKQTPVKPLGMDLLPEVRKVLRIPFTVMGGIKERHIPMLRAAGANTIAMVTEITQAPDVAERVAALRKYFPA